MASNGGVLWVIIEMEEMLEWIQKIVWRNI